jgi:hypothetical protein
VSLFLSLQACLGGPHRAGLIMQSLHTHASAVVKEMIACYGAPHRAALMDGLMKVGMRNRPERQHFALNILLNTYSSDLTTLKVRWWSYAEAKSAVTHRISSDDGGSVIRDCAAFAGHDR